MLENINEYLNIKNYILSSRVCNKTVKKMPVLKEISVISTIKTIPEIPF